MAVVAAREVPIALVSRESRARLSAMVTKLLDHWQLPAPEQAASLGLSVGAHSLVTPMPRATASGTAR